MGDDEERESIAFARAERNEELPGTVEVYDEGNVEV
jgi:hypothetical protein